MIFEFDIDDDALSKMVRSRLMDDLSILSDEQLIPFSNDETLLPRIVEAIKLLLAEWYQKEPGDEA